MKPISIENTEKTTIHKPLLEMGMNSRNHDELTCPPPRPTPTMQRRTSNDV